MLTTSPVLPRRDSARRTNGSLFFQKRSGAPFATRQPIFLGKRVSALHLSMTSPPQGTCVNWNAAVSLFWIDLIEPGEAAGMSALSSRWFHSRTNTGTLTLPFRPPSCACSFRATHSAFFRISISSALRSLAGTTSHKQGQGGQPLLLPHGDPSAQFRRKKK